MSKAEMEEEGNCGQVEANADGGDDDAVLDLGRQEGNNNNTSSISIPSALWPLPYFFPSIHPFVFLLPNNFFFLPPPTFVLFMESQLGFGMNTIGIGPNGPADKTGRHWRCRRK
jgi:hypothetical protein